MPSINIKGYEVIFDEADADFVAKHKWHASRCREHLVYIYTSIEGKHLAMHRIFAGTPKGKVTDHINGNTLDNRRSNLRVCTIAQNSWNQRKYGKLSRYKGVWPATRGPNWKAFIFIKKKETYLGTFKTEEEAARAYDAKAREVFGEFARTNFSEVTAL